MENMVNIFLFGKLYRVPDDLTIMRAMEYAGYQLVRGCGCRNGLLVELAPLSVCDVLHNVKRLSTALCAGVTAHTGIYVGVKLHHNLLCGFWCPAGISQR